MLGALTQVRHEFLDPALLQLRHHLLALLLLLRLPLAAVRDDALVHANDEGARRLR